MRSSAAEASVCAHIAQSVIPAMGVGNPMNSDEKSDCDSRRRAMFAGAAALGDPRRASPNVLLSSAELTIFAATWTPQINLMPHNHLMWASIGIHAGREDNIFRERTSSGIEAYCVGALFEKDTAMLPGDVLHSVTNPLLRFTGGIHVYGGDFFGTARSRWNPETLNEEPSDGEVIRGIFQRENERLGLDTIS